jgi:hypothetical protein
MAAGLSTLTVVANKMAKQTGVLYVDIISFAGDGVYPTGGTAAFKTTFQTLTKTSREPVFIEDVGGVAGTYLVYDQANDKLKAFVRTTGVEVANGVDLSGSTFKIAVVSI